MSFSLKRLYAFKDEEKQTGVPAQHGVPPAVTTKPLLPDKEEIKVTFAGLQYGATDDVTFYSMSDRIGRNYTPSSAGVSVSNLRKILRGQAVAKFPMPDFVDSAISDHRPLNVPAPKHQPPYPSKEMMRSISHDALKMTHASPRALSKSSRELSNTLTTALLTHSSARTAWEPNALATPRTEPRLFTETGEIPTSKDWKPKSRLLMTRDNSIECPQVVDASMPYDVSVTSIHQQVESSASQYQQYADIIFQEITKERTELQKIADVTIRRKWMERALSMVPKNYGSDRQILSFVGKLDQDHWKSNANARIHYELRHPSSQMKLGIDRKLVFWGFFWVCGRMFLVLFLFYFLVLLLVFLVPRCHSFLIVSSLFIFKHRYCTGIT